MFQLVSSSLLALFIGFIICTVFIYFLLRYRRIKIKKVDEKTLLLKLPIFGTIEVDEQTVYGGIFVRETSENFEKMNIFQGFIDFNLVLRYAHDYNISYIGFEGDKGDRSWSNGRLAYNTLSKGYHNIYLNPGLDREVVSDRLSKQFGLEIKPDELYTFLFFHQIGHTKEAGNESYVTALVNSLTFRRKAFYKEKACIKRPLQKS